MADRGLEPPNINGDLWPIGFDVDIALDSSTKNGLNNLNCNILTNPNNSSNANGYADVQQMFFNKLQDFNEREISQITDLTNSLPKGDNVHSLYSKFSCQELANELATGEDSASKVKQEVFSAHYNLSGQKQTCSMDIFGKVVFHDGKLTLQLKNFQVTPQFLNSIEECWICKEKILGANLESHKHTLHGLFQVSSEYVQIEIDQYLLPAPDISMSGRGLMKLPLNNLELPNIHANNLSSNDPYQPFSGRASSETDCSQLRFPCNVSHAKNEVPKAHSAKSLDEISFTPSLVTNDSAQRELPSASFINVNLPNIGMSERTPTDQSNMVSSDAPYLLPNVSTSDVMLMDKSHQHNTYSNNPIKHSEHYQNIFPNQCHYNEIATSNKSLVDVTESTLAIGQNVRKKVEVGARKRKSKLASKKPSVIKMREESKPPTVSGTEAPLPTATQENLLATLVHQTATEPSQPLPGIPTSSKVTGVVVKPQKRLRLTCYLCGNVYKSEALYIDHMVIHNVPKLELFSCQICAKMFDSAANYLLHVKIHRPKLTCGICGRSYGRLQKLNRHIDSAHNAKRPHKCTFCPKAFSRQEYLKDHLNIHTGIKFDCDVCGKKMSTKHNLLLHKKIHAGVKGHKCKQCEKSFLRRGFLETHVQRDHKNEKFECDVCLKLYSRNDVLKRHKAVHENSRATHSCHICKKSYSRKYILSKHLKTHENSNILKCDLCPGTFKKKHSLQKHIKIHKSKEQCNICYKFMPSSQRLQNHLLWHEKQLKLRFEREYFGCVKCDFCPKSFSSQQLLNRHATRSHKQNQDGLASAENLNEREKKFFCEHCSKGFTRSCNLKSHLKTHSNESEDEEMLAGLPSVLNASKSNSGKVKTTFPAAADSKYMRLENSTSKISEINHLTAADFPPPLEDFPHIAHHSHPGYATHGYENLPASTYINSGSPTSPINLSAEAITAAAYLLAYPSYPGPYH